MISIRFLSIFLLLSQAFAQIVWNGLNPGDTAITTRTDFWRYRLSHSASATSIRLNPIMKRVTLTTTTSIPTTTSTSTTTSRATVTIFDATTIYSTTFTATSTVTVPPPTTTTTTTTTSTTTSSTSACPSGAYRIQASGTGDFAVDGNFAQLQSAFGSGYRVLFNANAQNSQQFRLGGPTCDTLLTADNNLQAMLGGNANLHYVYLFPSVQAASALVNVNWESLVCVKNADNTLSCTGMQESIFQVTQGDPTLELGDQNYGEAVTLNLIPVPGSIF